MSEQPSRIPVATREALAQQVHMLRNNMMGPAADYIMVITTRGRKSGDSYTIPIGYLRDGETILALNNGGKSNWYKNVQVNPEVTLEIKGEAIKARGERITDADERAKVFDYYRSQRGANFDKLFGALLTASEDELLAARDHCIFVRFYTIQ